MAITEKEARASAINYMVAEYSIPSVNIVILRILPVIGAFLCRSSYSIELSITKRDGQEEQHQLSVNTISGDIVRIY